MTETIQLWNIVAEEGAFVTLENKRSRKCDVLKTDFIEVPVVGNIAVMKKHLGGSYAPIGELSRGFYSDPKEVEKLKSFLN